MTNLSCCVPYLLGYLGTLIDMDGFKLRASGFHLHFLGNSHTSRSDFQVYRTAGLSLRRIGVSPRIRQHLL